MKINNKCMSRNDPRVPHHIRMRLRKKERELRVRNVPADSPFAKIIGSGKYLPKIEDKKHQSLASKIVTGVDTIFSV